MSAFDRDSSEQDADSSADDLNRRIARETGAAARVAGLVEEAIEGLGYRLVRVQVTGADGQTLQIMAERPDGTMNVDDCETISKQLSPLLDAYEPLQGSYRLEISSPGIDRPLVRPGDFVAWAGYEAKLELSEPIEGRRRFRGTVEGFEDEEIRLEVDLGDQGRQILGIPTGLVASANLVLTDALIEESLRRSKAAGRPATGDGSDIPDDIEIDEAPPRTNGHS